MSTIWTFEDVYRGEDYIPKFGESLREHAMKIINFEKKNVIPLKIITKIKTIVIILVSIKVLHMVLAI